jgi:hypothetical protein
MPNMAAASAGTGATQSQFVIFFLPFAERQANSMENGKPPRQRAAFRNSLLCEPRAMRSPNLKKFDWLLRKHPD